MVASDVGGWEQLELQLGRPEDPLSVRYIQCLIVRPSDKTKEALLIFLKRGLSSIL